MTASISWSPTVRTGFSAVIGSWKIIASWLPHIPALKEQHAIDDGELGLVLLAMAQAAAPAVSPKTTRQAVSEGLTCQCGCGLTVANCNHPNCEFSVPAREKIDGLIAQGMDRAQIIAVFRAKYGEKVLSAPTAQG